VFFPERRPQQTSNTPPQVRDCSPQCIEISAVCNSKIPVGTDSVNRSGIWNGTRPGAAEGRTYAHGSIRHRAILLPSPEWASSKFSAKNQWVADAVGWRGLPHVQALAGVIITFSPSFLFFFQMLCQPSFELWQWQRQQLFSRHFYALARHLSSPATASDTTWSARRAEGRLTCLSVRCLSSYLIFSASFSVNQAAGRSLGKFTGARLG